MKGFIQVTDFEGDMAILVPVGKITGVVCDRNGDVYIEMGTDGGTASSGVLVRESFDEVKRKIEQSEA